MFFIQQHFNLQTNRHLFSKVDPKKREQHKLQKEKQFQAQQKKLKMVPGFKVVKGHIKTQVQKFKRSRANTLANKLYNSLNNPKSYVKNKMNNKKLFSNKNLIKDIKRYGLSKQAQFYNLAENHKKLRLQDIQNKQNKKYSKTKKLIQKMNKYHSLYQRYLKQQPKVNKKKVRRVEVKNLKDYIPIDDTDLELLTKHLTSQESNKPVLLNLDLSNPKVDWSYLNDEKEPIEFIQRYNDHHYNVQRSKESLEKLLQLLQICKYKAENFYDTSLSYTQILTENLNGCPTIFAYSLEIIDKISKWARNIIYNYIITNGNLIKVQKYVDYYFLTGNMLRDKELMTFGTFKQAVINSEGKSFNFNDYKVLYKTNVEYMLSFYNKVFMNYYPTILFMIKMTQAQQANRILCAYTTNMGFLKNFNKIYGIFMRQKNTKPKPLLFNKNDAYQFETNVSRAYSSSSIQNRDKRLQKFVSENTAPDYDAEKHKKYLNSIDLDAEKSQDLPPMQMYQRDPRRYTDGQDQDLIFINGELLTKEEVEQKKKHELSRIQQTHNKFAFEDNKKSQQLIQDLFDLPNEVETFSESEESQSKEEKNKNETQKDNNQNNATKNDQDIQTSNEEDKKNLDLSDIFNNKGQESSEESESDSQQNDQKDEQKQKTQTKEIEVQTTDNIQPQNDNNNQKTQENNSDISQIDQGIQADFDIPQDANNQTLNDDQSQINIENVSNLDKQDKQNLSDQINELLNDKSLNQDLNNIDYNQKQQNQFSSIETQTDDIQPFQNTNDQDVQSQSSKINQPINDEPIPLNQNIQTLEDQNQFQDFQNNRNSSQQMQVLSEQNQNVISDQIPKLQSELPFQDESQNLQNQNDTEYNKTNQEISQDDIDQQKYDMGQQKRMQNLQESIQKEENDIENLKNQIQQKEQIDQRKQSLPIIQDDDYLFTKEELENTLKEDQNNQVIPLNNIEQIEHQNLDDMTLNQQPEQNQTRDQQTQTDNLYQDRDNQSNTQKIQNNNMQQRDSDQNQPNNEKQNNSNQQIILTNPDLNVQKSYQTYPQNLDIINDNIQKGYQIKNHIKNTKYSIDNDDNYNFSQKPNKDINAVYINNSNIPNNVTGLPNQQIQITVPIMKDCQNYQVYHYQSKQDCQEHVKNLRRMRRII